MLYVLLLPGQMELLPVIVPGCTGATFTVTGKVCAEELPQVLLAITVMFPPVALALAFKLFVLLLPDHPPG